MVLVRVFHHRQQGIIALRENKSKVGTVTDNLVNNIASRMYKATADVELNVPKLLINDLAQLHGDKWVEDVALHVDLYSTASHAPSMSASSYTYDNEIIQKIKSFSGDVSGVIGEALCTVVLQRCFDLDDENLAHFRAHKATGIYPDFGIFFASTALQIQFAELEMPAIPTGFLQPAIPCEVKTMTTMDVGDARIRVMKAIGQIQNYWNGKEPPQTGILCIAVRNPELRSYDLNFIWCD